VLTRPDGLTDEALTSVLGEGWGIGGATIEYLAVGFGSHHWLVDAGGRRRFLTVDDLHARRREHDEPYDTVAGRLGAALSAAAFVADHGFEFVVAPIRSWDDTVLRHIDDRYVAALYPFVGGRSFPYGAFQSGEHFDAVLSHVVRLHDIADPAASGAATDDLVVPHRDDLLAALDELDQRWDTGPFAEAARSLLDSSAADVGRRLERYDVVAGVVAAGGERVVLTHGEPHPGNTMATPAGWLLVDWDTTLIAAPERDLARMTGPGRSAGDAYEALTGRRVLAESFDCYRMWWDVADICSFVAGFRQPHDDTADMRASLRYLAGYLDQNR
jgi:spectinomycin phosphotransferase/16S rRNA (guanine(1405)-N(7))-methyltransferase